MKKIKIVNNLSLEKYNKKYSFHKNKNIKFSRAEVEAFDKKYPSDIKHALLIGRKWAYIDNAYYEIPKPLTMLFSRKHLELKIGVCFAAVMGITATSIILGTRNDKTIEYITYKLDSDIELKKNPDYDIELVNIPNLPGKSLAHKNKNADATFKIQAFTDLHLDHKRECCNYTFSMLARNIMDYKPDLVVFCGDNITSSYNEPRTIQFAEMLEKLGVYWCAVLGNHEKDKDNPYCIERDRMINIWCQYPHCLIDNKDKYVDGGTNKVWGVGNSLVNLVSNNKVVQSLFFLDSGTEMTDAQKEEYANEIYTYRHEWHRGSDSTVDFYDHIKDNQVAWYKETFGKIYNAAPTNDKPHSTIFTHVPIIEQEDVYLSLFNEWENNKGIGLSQRAGKDHMRVYTDFPQSTTEWATNPAKSINDLYTLDVNSNSFVKGKYNRRREGVCYSPHDIRTEKRGESTPILAAMESFGKNNCLFAGHDHENNYTLRTKGQFVGYIQFGAYSTSNFYRDGLLGSTPYIPDNPEDHFGGHLNEGYSEIIYKETSTNGTERNVIDSIDTKENYLIWKEKKPELYNRALDVIRKQMLVGAKPKYYTDIHDKFLDGNQN